MSSLSPWLASIDKRVSEYFAYSRNQRLNKFFAILTHFGDGVFWLTMYIFVFFFLNDSFTRVLQTLIPAEFIGLFFVISLRYMTKRKRPDRNYISIIHWNKYSFPSHHSLRAFLIATVIGAYYPYLLLFLFLAAVIISFSRIYLLKHYPSDVLAGALLGILTANVSLRLF